ncbi:tRNA dihydrouridine synthase DusB [Rhabdothermincola salaria]|uniref:tRNA dihydrouridine synthase DusB n=1 Tax=Rhabdothermincola salaria TaxID=2903142 RepID=UPI001E28560D|nr:tRNA dihydrouridine synthase DusB [Rhabdothermincola salaria]MCD9625549.1 tRNA dihydrouridine synthase DusB [Rhabdothermincola salaria]
MSSAVRTPPAPLAIGPIHLAVPVVLAPMAGITNAAFRRLCRRFGGGLFVSEMVNARGLLEGGEKSWQLAAFDPDESPRSIQLYGTDPTTVGEAVRRLVGDGHVDHVDLNFGCPVPKVTRHGGGAALPARPRLFAAVVSAAVRAAGDVPVTVKMRMGLDDERLTYLPAGRLAAEAGAAAVALHARTAEQRYSGRARWDAIGALVEAVGEVAPVPVLGNGDIWTADDALAMVEATGCTGVVVGRACLGRPWFFAELEAAFTAAPVPPAPGLGAVVEVALTHARLLADAVGEPRAVLQMRKHLGWYLAGYPVGGHTRRALMAASSLDHLDVLLRGLDPNLSLPPGADALPRGTQAGPHPVVVPDGWLDTDSTTPPPAATDVLVGGG